MTYADAIKAFRKHLDKLKINLDFEVWLATAIELVTDIYGSRSQQYSSILGIQNDYKIRRITEESNSLESVYRTKTIQLIKNFIEQLTDKHALALAEEDNQNKLTEKREDKLNQELLDLKKRHNDAIDEINKLQQDIIAFKNSENSEKKVLKVNKGVYHIDQSLFWTISLALLSGFFAFGLYVGTTKFDKNLIELSEGNSQLKKDTSLIMQTVRERDNSIEYMRHVSDSALTILSNMPYNEMHLDSVSFRKVQTTIENAGKALLINKNYNY